MGSHCRERASRRASGPPGSPIPSTQKTEIRRAMTHPDRNNGAETGHARRPGTFRLGNPGRPPGARNKATLAALALLEGEAEALTRRCVEMALAGDATAMRLCLDRLLP